MAQSKIKQKKSARETAYQILFEFERTHNRIDYLESKYIIPEEYSKPDRRLMKQLYSGVVRNMLYLDWVISLFYHGRMTKMLDKTKTILRLALYEIIYLKNIPEHATVNEYVTLADKRVQKKQAGLVNAILRSYLRTQDIPDIDKQISDTAERISIRYSFPLWLVKRWISIWGAERTQNLCKAFNNEPEFDVFINPEKVSAVDFEEKLLQNGIEYKKSDLFDDIYKIRDIQKLIRSGWLQEGLCTVQDESAHIPVRLLQIKETDIILDACAAPGGKYVQMFQGDKKPYMAAAVDIDKLRLKKIRDNLERLNIANSCLVVADSRRLPFKAVFTKILLDAPCSGLGVIRKHPDIKWRRNKEDLKSFAGLQSELIIHASKHLKKNGYLVYSTCTIDPKENEEITDNFIKNSRGQFEPLKPDQKFKNIYAGYGIRTFPGRDSMDGSYCAVFRKNSI
jgi:16S rRNA (cytosine967-C5)-methyltransferase